MPRKRKPKTFDDLINRNFKLDLPIFKQFGNPSHIEDERRKTRKVRIKRNDFLLRRSEHLRSGGAALTPEELRNSQIARNLIGGVDR